MASTTTTEMTRNLEHHRQQVKTLERNIAEWWKPFHKFLDLPPELRVLIYDWYTVASIPPNQLCIPCLPHNMPIANTSQLVRKEYLDAFYKTQAFPLLLLHNKYVAFRPHRRRGDILHAIRNEQEFFTMTDEDFSRIRQMQITPASESSSQPSQRGSRDPKPDRLGWTLDFAKGLVMAETTPEVLKAASKYVKVGDRAPGLSEYGNYRVSEASFLSIAAKLQDVMNHIVHMGGRLQRDQVQMLVVALSDRPKIPYVYVG